MAAYQIVVLLLVSLLEANRADPVASPKHGVRNSLDDVLSNQQYKQMYQEMMRITQESKEASDEEDVRLRRIVGEDNFKIFQGGVSRRRGGPHHRSAVGRRRARSQAIRREKLNSQSLRSHMQHARQAFEHSFEATH